MRQLSANTEGGQAPDRAKRSNRAGAGDNERTRPTTGTKPICSWVTPKATSPATALGCKMDPHSQVTGTRHCSATTKCLLPPLAGLRCWLRDESHHDHPSESDSLEAEPLRSRPRSRACARVDPKRRQHRG